MLKIILRFLKGIPESTLLACTFYFKGECMDTSDKCPYETINDML